MPTKKTSTKKTVLLLVALTPLVGLCAEREAEADVGSCYSVRPICLYPTTPICVCDIQMRCFWACR